MRDFLEVGAIALGVVLTLVVALYGLLWLVAVLPWPVWMTAC